MLSTMNRHSLLYCALHQCLYESDYPKTECAFPISIAKSLNCPKLKEVLDFNVSHINWNINLLFSFVPGC